jgi:phosphoribosylanthranilate isomerase
MVKVKICGITRWTDAKKSFTEGAELLGFNFYRKSPRYITPAAARRIVRRLPKNVKAVGVFVNESEENILATVRIAGLHQVQLHGDEKPEMVARLRRKIVVIKAVRVGERSHISQLSKFAKADAFLLDAFDSKQRGGTGRTFDWSLLRNARFGKKVFLAGGLTAENIRHAIRIVKPYAVDVCTGVEARPGKKDPRRITALMLAVKSAKKSTPRISIRASRIGVGKRR